MLMLMLMLTVAVVLIFSFGERGQSCGSALAYTSRNT
jgi:hypothetical protein